MSLLGSIPGLSSLLGGVAGAAQPGPSTAERGPDYNPVTNINAVGGIDYAGLGSLLNSIGYNNSSNGGLSTNGIVGDLFTGQSGTSYNPLIIIVIIGLVGILIWRKFGK